LPVAFLLSGGEKARMREPSCAAHAPKSGTDQETALNPLKTNDPAK
jgi:hypothetical protein